MDKKKVLSALSVLGLSGGLMFSVSALSADTVLDTSDSTISPLSGGNGNGNGNGPDCEGGSPSATCTASP